MADYIDREAAEKVAERYGCTYGASLGRHSGLADCIASEIEALPAADVSPVRHGEWEWFEEWIPCTTEHPRECEDCGWRCGNCKQALEDMVGGYWDNPDETPKLAYCPNCGAKMDGGGVGRETD